MNSRDEQLKNLRPKLAKAKVLPETSDEERFQNEVLRPVAKLQNDLLVQIFQNYIEKRKNVFYGLGKQERFEYIERAVKKDSKLKKFLRGIIVGQFTLKELQIYQENASRLNKRIHNLVKERLQDQMQLFE